MTRYEEETIALKVHWKIQQMNCIALDSKAFVTIQKYFQEKVEWNKEWKQFLEKEL